MRRSSLQCLLVATVFAVQGVAHLSRAAGPYARASDSTIDLGRRIFEHNWSQPQSWTGPATLGSGGDGLGPLFNAVSCVACHNQGGVGGAGGNAHNVELLNVVLRRQMPPDRRARLLDEAERLHPFFNRTSAGIVLHRFGYGPAGDPLEYQSWKNRLIRRNDPDIPAMGFTRRRMSSGDFPLELAYRNTPALWGLGLIEEIRSDRGHLRRREQMRLQQRSPRGVSGRAPRTADGDHGWYGWRGQVGDLREFVLNACANELGLEVPGRFQPDNPLHRTPPRKRPTRLDLTGEQVAALTAYIAHLPQPVRIEPDDPDERQAAVDGERLFHLIGCAECHVDVLGDVGGVYSDLLLHDMGPRTSDHATAIPAHAPARRVTQSAGGYSGGSFTTTIPSQEIQTNIDQEWRTPPLWGVADSAPYLHDGRAPTLDAAIRLHDGESTAAIQEYRRLSEENRRQLLTFLRTLRAPRAAGE